jgi:ATP-dependent Lon protease
MTTRDQTAIRKTFSGLVKLLYPDKNITHEEALELVDFAVEGRRRVKEQLYIIDETFKNEPVKFSYVIKSTEKEVEINTLEVMNFNKTKTIIPTEVSTDEKTKDSTNKKILQPKQIAIRDNQTSISYQKLFGDYVEGAKKITITDPYIRMPYQFKNLVEFCVMLLNLKSAEEEINLHVITWNSEMYIQDSIDNFEEIKENVTEMGINLTWEFQDYHDRNIIIDNGWKINLGRGLDIFEPREGRLNIGDFVQENRKCKNCEITFLNQK